MRGDRQPIKGENNAPKTGSLKEICKAASSNEMSALASELRRQLYQLAVKPPVRRPFIIALIDKCLNILLESSIQRVGEINVLKPTNMINPMLQTVISLLKEFDEHFLR